MRIAAVTADALERIEPLLSNLAAALAADGWQVSGAVQKTVPATATRRKRMELLIYPTGEVREISASRAPGTAGCVLDPGALEQAAETVARSIGPETEAVVLSKFGQRECEGRGFRAALVAAADHDIPALIGVAPSRMEALTAFLGEAPQRLEGDVRTLRNWLEACRT